MLLDRGVQAVARGAARCALHVHGSGAWTDACGRSFAVLSTQVSTAQPDMLWRIHHTKSDPKSMRVMPLCLWGV